MKPPVKQRDLAERIGTTKANLSRIENGKQELSVELLPKLVAETGISASRLRPDLEKLFVSTRSRRRRRSRKAA
jgi:transcriptional regulator with XRE-family HTH domain